MRISHILRSIGHAYSITVKSFPEITWGEGYDWPRVRELLEQLLAEEILQYADADESGPIATQNVTCPSPLPVARSTVPRTWLECEAITHELTGHTVELGYLELVVPIFRVVHLAMDAEGRQIAKPTCSPNHCAWMCRQSGVSAHTRAPASKVSDL